MTTSLRRRTILGAVIWAVLSTVLGSFALVAITDAAADRRFTDILIERHLRVVTALATLGAPDEDMNQFFADTEFSRPYSGSYWQVLADEEVIATSTSLFDSVIEGGPSAGQDAAVWEGSGPEGAVRVLRQVITLEGGQAFVVDVAESTASLEAEMARLRNSIWTAFAFVGVLGVAGALLLSGLILRPLTRLRSDLVRRGRDGSDLTTSTYPDEIRPLAEEINDLIARNNAVVERSSRQASDLAHGLKTPLAALRNDIAGFRDTGVDTRQAVDSLNRIDAQIGRSLARFRAETNRQHVRLATDGEASVNRILRLFRTLPEARHVTLEMAVVPGIKVALDMQDFEEILGNLIENAVKWARSRVRISMSNDGKAARLHLEDDGPGIAESEREIALGSGYRLDTAKPGTGLGLAIVRDLVLAYDGKLELGVSEKLGGLRVTLVLPTPGDALHRSDSTSSENRSRHEPLDYIIDDESHSRVA